MAEILETKSIYFNDVNVIPYGMRGKVISRKDVPNELFRIIVSPMVSIVGRKFTEEAAKLGLSIATPRFIPTKEKISLAHLFERNKINKQQICFISIGLNEKQDDLELFRRGSKHRDFLFDIANGYIVNLKERVHRVSKEFKFNNLMVGNIITFRGVDKLIFDCKNSCNQLFIRVGIGNGSPCSSSDVAGINRGQITELMECHDWHKNSSLKYYFKKVNLVSDGGISKSGFALKAFGAGADYCLMGGYFSKALEAETHISGDGTYFGCASEKQNKLAGLLKKHSEGKVTKVNKDELKPLEYLVDELWGGISSGISYSQFGSVCEFIGNATFEIKENSLPPKVRI